MSHTIQRKDDNDITVHICQVDNLQLLTMQLYMITSVLLIFHDS